MSRKKIPSYQVESVKIENLIPYAKNSRTHSDEQVAQIAASIREFGFTNPVLIDAEDGIIAGHGRVLAARKLQLSEVPCLRLSHLTNTQRRAYVIADNKLALNSGWDEEMLKVEFSELDIEGFDLSLTGFNDAELEALLSVSTVEGNTDPDEVPEPPPEPVSVLGDVWQLGKHRIACGDSTMIDPVKKLMDGKIASLIHADPPYGMGKESDGVANDNIYREELDKFQMDWWVVFRMFTAENGSAYIWGNAPDLWRLWYCGGLGKSEILELRNQIVWDKKCISGMKSALLHQYPQTTEHCLFFQFGQQFRGSVNTSDFPKEWELILEYIKNEATAAGVQPKDIKRVCGVEMYSHWFSSAQFQLIPKKHYEALAFEYSGYFLRSWKDIKREWDSVKSIPTYAAQKNRSYFDNAHDVMRDVWEFSRVNGKERHGHATPKPVEMMERIMKSSLPKGGLVIEPFGGSGSTLIGAEKTGRVCYSMELNPAYVDVAIERWQNFTGKQAVHAELGKSFAELKAQRVK